MAYTVLARKYRSASFDELIGQEHIAQTLKRAISSGRIAHAFLFCGTRGTGKTSTARILAKCLNCQSDDKAVTTPCNQCNSCQAIARGEDMSVIEIDAASNTGVDNIREVIEGAYNSPPGRFKIYIIDEVHMLSKNAFNALLKTLEEPPAHVKFILATTEPEKVLPTILSRCQRYDFRNIPTREIAGHLKNICKQEKIDADDDALLLVAKAGSGSMRDSLSLLDRLLSLGEKQLNIGMIEQLLGLPKSQLLFDLADAIGQGDVASSLQQVDAILAGGLSADALIAALVDHLRNLLILRTCGEKSNLVEVPGLSMKDLLAQASKFEPILLAQDIAILEELRRQMRVSQAGRAILDATIVRLALAEQFTGIGQLLAGGGAQKKKPELSANISREAASDVPEPPAPSRNIPAPPIESPVETSDDALPAVGKVFEGPKRSMFAAFKAAASNAPKPAPEPSNIEPVAPGEFADRWSAVLEALRDKSPGVHGVLSQGRLLKVEDNTAVVEVMPHLEMLVRGFDRNGKKEVIQGALVGAFGEGITLQFQYSAVPEAAAPAAKAPAKAQATTSAASAPASFAPPAPRMTPEQVDAAKQDPFVRAVLEQLGGSIVKIET